MVSADPRKRRKTTMSPEISSPETSAPLPEKHVVYTQWALNEGIEIHGVAPAILPGRGVGLVATSELKKNARLIFVPEKAMIKPNPSLIKKNKLLKASPQAQLAACLSLEADQDSQRYRASKAVWPTPQDFQSCMVAYSSHGEVAMLIDHAPPSVRKPLDRLLLDMKKDVEAVEHLFGSDNEQYLYHWLLVNTRSFHWKPTGVKNGAMVMCPFLDYMNHCPNGEGCTVTVSTEGYELKANRDYEPGEEILATYGAHPNDKLLVHYGFILEPSNPDDEIRLDHVVIPRLTEAQQNALQDVGFLGGYSLDPNSDEICFKTHVAVRSVLLTANEWEHYMGSGEDLALDQEREVRAWLTPALEAYIDEAETAVDRLEISIQDAEGSLKEKLDLLRRRWVQIYEALNRFQLQSEPED
ncbi:hypothetical protein MBLNU459_g6634t1 [Dothideomycetes sp. NU459]